MNWFKLECTTHAFVTALQLTVRYEMSVIIIIIIIIIITTTRKQYNVVIGNDMFYFHSHDGSTVGTVALLASTCEFGKLDCFYRASA